MRAWISENQAATIAHLHCFPGDFGNFKCVWVTDIWGVLSLQPDLSLMNGRMEGRAQILRTLLRLTGDRGVRRAEAASEVLQEVAECFAGRALSTFCVC